MLKAKISQEITDFNAQDGTLKKAISAGWPIKIAFQQLPPWIEAMKAEILTLIKNEIVLSCLIYWRELIQVLSDANIPLTQLRYTDEVKWAGRFDMTLAG